MMRIYENSSLQGAAANWTGNKSQETGQDSSFGDIFNQAIENINRLQFEAEDANRQLISGQVEDLHQIVLTTEKAEISLQLALQVRNKVLEAYQELMRMQV